MNPQDVTAPPGKDALLALFQARRLPEAKALGEALIREQPQDAEAWQLLGVIQGALGESEAAAGCFRRAIELHPDYLKAHRNLVVALINQGRTKDAIASLRTVIRLAPEDVEARYGLGNFLYDEGDREGAEAAYREVVRLKPDHVEAHNNLGAIYTDQGRLDDAMACYRQALKLKPDHVEAHYNLGLALHALGRLEEAETSLREVLGIRPSYAEAHFHLGTVLRDKGETTGAEAAYRRAIELDPTCTNAYIKLAVMLEEQSRFEEALDCLKQALHVNPRSPEVLTNLGIVYMRLNRFAEALASHNEAIRINPNSAKAYYNLAVLYNACGRYDEGIASANDALRLNPDYALVHTVLAHIKLRTGCFSEGWQHYGYRYFLNSNKPPLPPSSLPEDLSGQRILMGQDQGLGDEIFFLRFAPQLKARGAWVAYCPNPKLASILERVGCVDRLVAWGEPLEKIAYTFSVGDLPLLLGMDQVAKIPAPLPLTPLPERLAAMRQRLSELGPPPYLGVTWRAGTQDSRGLLYKEFPLERMAEALRGLPGTVLILQRHPQPGEVAAFSGALGRTVHDLSAVNEDLEDMLALLSLMDEYVGVSNTNMHLRAGLGRTARVLVPHPPEWRWMAEGDESPWFKGFAIYRQGYDKNWGQAFENLKKDLSNPNGG